MDNEFLILKNEFLISENDFVTLKLGHIYFLN